MDLQEFKSSAAAVGGSDTQVLFNDSGSEAGDSGLTFNKTTNRLTVTGAVDTPFAYNSSGNFSIKDASGSTDLITFNGNTGEVSVSNIFPFSAGAATFNRAITLKSYTVATLPTAGTGARIAFATDARKADQETPGSGSTVEDDGTDWLIIGTTIVATA